MNVPDIVQEHLNHNKALPTTPYKVYSFEGHTGFEGYYAANEFAKELGYVTGSMEGDYPIGLAPEKTYSYVSKWNNMTRKDHSRLSGVILSENFRSGDSHVVIYKKEVMQLSIEK